MRIFAVVFDSFLFETKSLAHHRIFLVAAPPSKWRAEADDDDDDDDEEEEVGELRMILLQASTIGEDHAAQESSR